MASSLFVFVLILVNVNKENIHLATSTVLIGSTFIRKNYDKS